MKNLNPPLLLTVGGLIMSLILTGCLIIPPAGAPNLAATPATPAASQSAGQADTPPNRNPDPRPELIAQGYTLIETAPDLEWAGAIYRVELYAPPANDPKMLRHLFIFKTGQTPNTQIEQIKQIAHERLTLDLPMARLAGSTWRDLNHDTLPELAYCLGDCGADVEAIHFFQLQADGALVDLSLAGIQFGLMMQNLKVYELAEIEWRGRLYQAAIYGPPEQGIAHQKTNRLQIYRAQNGETTALFRAASDDLFWHTLPSYSLGGVEVSGWQDINQDGRPELIFSAQQTVTGICEKQVITIVQIQPDGSLAEIPTGPCVWRGEDVDGDGRLELIYGATYDSAFGCPIHTACWTSDIYAWNGEAYVEADRTQFAPYYQAQIDRAIARLEIMLAETAPLTGDDLMLLEQVIISYQQAHREAEGLRRFDAYADPAHFAGRLDDITRAELLKLRAFYDLPTTE